MSDAGPRETASSAYAAGAGIARVAAALHPLSSPPDGRGWNLRELEDFITPATALTEAAVLVGLVDRGSATTVLLTRRTEALRNHAGQVSFPGGRIEPGDRDAVAAALRETEEEIGVPSTQLTPLGYLDPLATVTGFRVLPVVARIAPDYVARPDPDEVAAVFELPLAFLLAADSLQEFEIEFRGRARRIHEFRPHEFAPDQRLWGVSASILYNLRERLASR